MQYVIANGKQYIKTPAKLVTSINDARKFPNIALAEKVKKNMKKTFKKMGIWNIIPYECDTLNRNVERSTDVDSNGKITSYVALENGTMSLVLADNISDNYKKLLSYKATLETVISNKEKETQDILHFIEFYDLNAYQGFETYKMLQQVRTERRKAKNELIRINNFLKASCEDILNWKVDTKEKKSYTPRILTDLFKGKYKRHEV